MALITKVGLEFVAKDKSKRAFSGVNRSLAGMSRTLLNLAGIGGGLYALDRGFKAVIKSASDAQEIQSKFNVVFGKTGKEANKWAEDFGDAVGRATQDVQGWMATLQDTFVPLGFARAEAAAFSKTLTKLAVDVASFNNKADADVVRDFQSALVGNHETVRRYGVIISQTAIEQAALNKGWKQSYKDLTDLEKVQLRMDILLANTSDAQDDATRTASEYANQVKRLSANWKEFKQTIGGIAIVPASIVVETVNKIFEGQAGTQFLRGPGSGGVLSGMDRPGPIPIGLRTNIVDQALAERRAKRQATAVADKEALMKAAREYSKILHEQHRNPLAEAYAKDESLRKQVEMIKKLMPEYGRLINDEIALTGRLGEAREHAAQRQKLHNDLVKEGVTNTTLLNIAMTAYDKKLRELAAAQQLARIAENIGDAFASAFERAIFQANKFRDVLKGLAQDIAKSVFRNIVSQPIAQGISAGVGAFFGLTPAAVGTAAGQPAFSSPHGGPVAGSRHSGGAIYKSGLYDLQAGEFVQKEGGPQVIINNNTGIPFESSGQTFDGEKMIIDIEAALAGRMERGAGPLAAQLGR